MHLPRQSNRFNLASYRLHRPHRPRYGLTRRPPPVLRLPPPRYAPNESAHVRWQTRSAPCPYGRSALPESRQFLHRRLEASRIILKRIQFKVYRMHLFEDLLQSNASDTNASDLCQSGHFHLSLRAFLKLVERTIREQVNIIYM